nr:hypothetical protein [Phocaeicola vulgatus]
METSIYIFIAAVICEVQSWNEIEEFGNSKMTAWSSSPVMILLTDSSV